MQRFRLGRNSADPRGARFTLCALAVIATAACGDGGEARSVSMTPASSIATTLPSSTSTTVDSVTTAPSTEPEDMVPVGDTGGLVIDRRPMTAAEGDRISGEAQPLDCPDVGGWNWDYEQPGPDTPGGRTSDDALVDAITEINDDARDDLQQPDDYNFLPLAGWVELTQANSSTFVHDDTDWQFLIEVGGDPARGIWRPNKAVLCVPAG